MTRLVCSALLVFGFSVCLSGQPSAHRTLTVPDDYPTIQAAIDAASPGDAVFIRAGRYRESLLVAKPISLRGDSREAVWIVPSDGPAAAVAVLLTEGQVGISDLWIHGAPIGAFLAVEAGAAVSVERIRVAEAETGLAATGSGSVSVARSYFADNVIGVYLAVAVATLDEVELIEGGIGILVGGTGSTRIRNCLFGAPVYAIHTHTIGCGWGDGPDDFAGTLEGEGNRIFATKDDLCPDNADGLWPELFVDRTWAAGTQRALRLFLTGSAMYQLQSYLSALSQLQECLRLIERYPYGAFEAMVRTNMGGVLVLLSLHDQAISEFRAARAIYDERGMQVSVAEVDQNMGAAYMEQGNYPEALAHLWGAKAVFIERGMLDRVAGVSQNLGIAFRRMGRYEEAISQYKTALEIYHAADMKVEVAKVRANLGAALVPLGRYSQALDLFSEARAVFADNNLPMYLALIDHNMGITYYYLALLDPLLLPAALQCMERARTAFAEHSMDAHLARVNRNIALVYSRLGLHKAALDVLQEARDLFARRSLVLKRAEAEVNIGVTLAQLGLFQDALEVYATALATLNTFPPPPGAEHSHPDQRWTVELNRGIAFEGLGQWGNAATSYGQAAAVVESVREGLAGEEIKLSWGQHTRHVYERLIDLLYRMDQGQEALPYAERSRARTFLDLLAQGPVGTLEHVEDEGIRSGVVEAAVIEADLWEVIGDLPEDTAVLEYFTTDKAVYLWVITRGEVRDPIKIEVDRGVLLDQVRQFREAIETPITTANEAAVLRTVLEQARDLYDLLLAPVVSEIAGYRHLVIIPSGPLHYLPFAALYDCPGCAPGAMLVGGEGSYLVQRFTLSYLPSLTTLKYAERQGRASTPEPTFLGLADPDARDPRFSRLPQAQVEVQTIATQFPEEGRTVYVDLQATEETLRAQVSGARYVVLSTHGSFNPHNPMHSFLLLAPSGDTRETDGRLYTHEVFGLGLQADLVTLSACETLLPSLQEAERQVRAVRGADADDTVRLPSELLERITAGDELVGLTRAFIYAGTPTVLSTLWSVYDVPTRDLMVGFYENLGQAEPEMNKAQALQAAQVALLTREDESGTRRYRHPVYWAAFTLYGDWR